MVTEQNAATSAATMRQYHIKWKGWAYIHSTHHTSAELSLFKGYKKVLLYDKGLEQEAEWRAVR